MLRFSHFHSCNFKETLSPLQIKTFSYHLEHFILRSLEICDNLAQWKMDGNKRKVRLTSYKNECSFSPNLMIEKDKKVF